MIIQSVDSAYVKYTNLSRRPHERFKLMETNRGEHIVETAV